MDLFYKYRKNTTSGWLRIVKKIFIARVRIKAYVSQSKTCKLYGLNEVKQRFPSLEAIQKWEQTLSFERERERGEKWEQTCEKKLEKSKAWTNDIQKSRYVTICRLTTTLWVFSQKISSNYHSMKVEMNIKASYLIWFIEGNGYSRAQWHFSGGIKFRPRLLSFSFMFPFFSLVRGWFMCW